VRVAGYLVFVLALGSYLRTWQIIRKLVSEVNQLSLEKHYSWIWWHPAWKAHRKACPKSRLRRQIVGHFLLTFALLSLAMCLIASPIFR